jgi:hypothetical protein
MGEEGAGETASGTVGRDQAALVELIDDRQACA